MRKVIAILLALGIMIVGTGLVHAATLEVNVGVQSDLSMGLDKASLTYTNVKPGVASEKQTVTATTTGGSSYQLTLTGATFNTTGGTAPANALQFKDSGLPDTSFKGASASAQNILSVAGNATSDGDEKSFDLRVLFPLGSKDGNYATTITITAAPQ